MIIYKASIVDVDKMQTVVYTDCKTFECAKSFIESALLKLVKGSVSTKNEWRFYNEKATINISDECPVHGKIMTMEEKT